ncbi:MAG: hypothetical protein JXB36_16425 [Gammaproteobacteria bacterium]|nr:hypothetical protein [Gammaproteobacteria bacterium]
MSAGARGRLFAHLVGSLPLPDAETAFRTVSRALGPHVLRIPDGETGIRRSWIRYLQDVLAAHPAVEAAADLPPFRFVQWDGRLIREIPRLRVVPGRDLDPNAFETGYADMAIDSWRVFERLQDSGVIPPHARFQISLPTPIAPIYNNMVPDDRPVLLPALTRHFVGEVQKIAAALPRERIAVQWDVCQEVLAWEGYYERGPVDFRSETLETLAAIGDAVPAAVELGYHLCYGSPADEHLVQPTDAAVMTDMVCALLERIERHVHYFHLPVPKTRRDGAYFEPLRNLRLDPATHLYLGLIHHADAEGDAARLAAARRHARVDGVGTECGMARGDPSRLDALLSAHAALIERSPLPPGTR